MAPDDTIDLRPPLREQAMSALRLQAGTAEVLVLLFVALVRSMEVPTRYVQLMDVLPLEPWKRRATAAKRVLSPREVREREASHAAKEKRVKGTQLKPGKDAEGAKPVPKAEKPETMPQSKRRKKADDAGKAAGPSDPAAVAAAPLANSVQEAPPRNRGEEEFEREIQLALMATEAEAQARAASSSSLKRAPNPVAAGMCN